MKVAVIGGGIMGSGIAQVAAMAGHGVALCDVGREPLARAQAAIRSSLARFVKSGKLTQEQAGDAERRIRTHTDVAAAVVDAEIVVEAVPEILALKQEVLGKVAEAAPAGALFGTNTSQLSITSIGTAIADRAERLVGTHFFNPPVMMQLVELIRGLRTTDAAIAEARAFASGLGKEVVVCQKDSPGFITSRAYAMLRMECLRILDEGVASAEDIDKALKLGFNLPMGPLELGDFNGLDTYLHAVTALADVYGERFRPPAFLRNMVNAGLLGRKSGRGFYRYGTDGKRIAE